MKTTNSFVTSVRLDLRTVATLVLWLRKNNIEPGSRNNLITISLEALKENLLKQDSSLSVTSTTKALEILKQFDLMPKAKKQRNLKTLTNQLAIESLNAKSDTGPSFEALSAPSLDDAMSEAQQLLEQNLSAGKRTKDEHDGLRSFPNKKD